ITADTESGAYVLETGVPVAGDMAGDRIVVAETEAFREIALPDPVDIGTDGKGAVEGSIQHLGTNASVHALQQTEIAHAIPVVRQSGGACVLQVVDADAVMLEVVGDACAHARQLALCAVIVLVEIADQIIAQAARQEAVRVGVDGAVEARSEEHTSEL